MSQDVTPYVPSQKSHVTTFVTKSFCALGLIIAFGCMMHPPAERVELPQTWLETKEQWQSAKIAHLIAVSYITDAGSVIAYLADGKGRRWDMLLESPGQGGRQLTIAIKLGKMNDAMFYISRGSSEEKCLIRFIAGLKNK